MRAAGSQATPEVIETWVEVYKLFQQCRGERRERLQQVADLLGVSFKVARRRLRNYEAMVKAGTTSEQACVAPAVEHRPEPTGQLSPRQDVDDGMSSGVDFQDRVLTCGDCGQAFTWSAAEQAFFREKGFTEPPKRCKSCRQARKDRQGNVGNRKGSRK